MPVQDVCIDWALECRQRMVGCHHRDEIDREQGEALQERDVAEDKLNWPSRTPASNPPAARSTSSSPAEISTSTSGKAWQKDAISGSRGTTARDTVRRNSPVGRCARSRAN